MQRIVVLAGGKSTEREVSLNTGRGIAAALKEKGYDVTLMDVDNELPKKLLALQPDAVHIALHGRYGEDGTIQGMLEIMGIPYTGSGVLASALAMNKIMAKKIFRYEGIPTPQEVVLNKDEVGYDFLKVILMVRDNLKFPVVVKPGSEGSSVGLSIVRREEELVEAVKKVFLYDSEALVEEYIKGMEVTVGILGNKEPVALPPVEIVPAHEFYDYESKYVKGMSEHIIPARLGTEVLEMVKNVALKAHKALGCSGYSRVDLIVNQAGKPYVLEVNTLPGMTETSLLPDAAKAAGMSYSDLTEYILRLALEKRECT